MGPIPIDRIISISSEDLNHKGENILNVNDSHKTWRCKSGEKQATIILQFLKPSAISSIDVGNDNSAFVEIFVGKSTSDEFHLLLVTSSLMTMHDCKNGLNVNNVRFFNANQLSPIAKESWDRVKIVCTQSYIKQAKFGLSFITFHSKDKLSETTLKESILTKNVQLGSFTLRSDDDCNDDITFTGRLFAKRNDVKPIVKMPESPVSRLLASHKKKNNNSEIVQKLETKDSNTAKKLTTNLTSVSSKKNPHNPRNDNLNNKNTNDKEISQLQNKDTNRKQPATSPAFEKPKKKIKLIQNLLPAQKPFIKLLENVIFAMSGYENPYRRNVRDKAAEMGATYKANWDSSCTHLLCAFTNTPKYREAKTQGCRRIVKSDWIDKCFSNRCRYPWRRFALDKTEQNKPESEDEIHEITQLDDPVEEDDEWNSIAKSNIPSTSQIKTPHHDIYDADTDVDSDSSNPVPNDVLSDNSNVQLPHLDNVFTNYSFWFSPNLDPLEKKKCQRYIIALDGQLNSKDNCDYIISTNSDKRMLDKPVVSPHWIWDCHDARKILPLN
ncbi:DNA repair protein XRCC1 [Adelges cooleyi]|uniref:DNA repair protein XRCC1 n=1 Tax=Adelges cooleyi TaxID=133065 RepID=UPI00217F7302|nr:DNA repair protein XRCC1 [Adelges cooleyi]